MKDNIYKVLFAASLGIVIAGVGTWLVLGQHAVTRQEMTAYVADEMDGVTKLSTQVETLAIRVQDLTTQLAVLNARLEAQGTLGSHPRGSTP